MSTIIPLLVYYNHPLHAVLPLNFILFSLRTAQFSLDNEDLLA